jgi:hypothetical protein
MAPKGGEILSAQTNAVQAFVDGYLNRNLETFRRYIHPEMIWFRADGTKQIEGSKAFFELVQNSWRNNPKLKNVSSEYLQIGNIVTHAETFSGYEDGRTEEWIWVYEFLGEQIIKMYGFQPTVS